jgi:hypothetical protein
VGSRQEVSRLKDSEEKIYRRTYITDPWALTILFWIPVTILSSVVKKLHSVLKLCFLFTGQGDSQLCIYTYRQGFRNHQVYNAYLIYKDSRITRYIVIPSTRFQESPGTYSMCRKNLPHKDSEITRYEVINLQIGIQGSPGVLWLFKFRGFRIRGFRNHQVWSNYLTDKAHQVYCEYLTFKDSRITGHSVIISFARMKESLGILWLFQIQGPGITRCIVIIPHTRIPELRGTMYSNYFTSGITWF